MSNAMGDYHSYLNNIIKYPSTSIYMWINPVARINKETRITTVKAIRVIVNF